MNQLATQPKWRKKEVRTTRKSRINNTQQSGYLPLNRLKSLQQQFSLKWVKHGAIGTSSITRLVFFFFLKQAIFTYFAEKSSFTILHYFVVGSGRGCSRRLQVYGHMNGCFVWGIGILVWRNAQAGIFTVLVLFFCTRAVHAHEGTLCFTYNLFLFFLQLICCLWSCGFFLWFSGLVFFTMNIETIAVLVVPLCIIVACLFLKKIVACLVVLWVFPMIFRTCFFHD